MSSFYPGRRLSFNNHLCTVRYHGPLSGQTGDWLGVEWDEQDRGKHNGHYEGKQIFRPLSLATTSSSFIRPSRVADTPRSFLEALRHKYGEEDLERNHATNDSSIEISGKVVEEVGFDQIRKQQAALQELKIVVLDGMRIEGVRDEDTGKVQQEIANTCPNIMELDVSCNLFEDLKEIAAICAPLKRLLVLKMR
jgi:tubulin-specific chaperone E